MILDYGLPELDGLGVIDEMVARSIPMPVVLVTGRLDSHVAVAAMRSGAVNCVEKPLSMSELSRVLEDAFGLVASVKKMHEAKGHRERFDQLSEQEKQIVRFAADGMPNKKIASLLGISIKTVEKYRRRAYEKLGVDCTALMARAVTLQSMHNMLHSGDSPQPDRIPSPAISPVAMTRPS